MFFKKRQNLKAFNKCLSNMLNYYRGPSFNNFLWEYRKGLSSTARTERWACFLTTTTKALAALGVIGTVGSKQEVSPGNPTILLFTTALRGWVHTTTCIQHVQSSLLLTKEPWTLLKSLRATNQQDTLRISHTCCGSICLLFSPPH